MYRIICFLGLFIFLVACEEVIEVELDNADSQIVIEAKVSNNPENNLVSMTFSTNFYSPSQYERISGAEISITEVNGESFQFSEMLSGEYGNENLIAEVGSEYIINVDYNNVTYTAKSSLRQHLSLDSITVIEGGGFLGDDSEYEITCYFQDHPGYDDYARFKIYVNDELRDGIFLYDDRLTDGNHIENDQFMIDQEDDKDKIKPGDIVKVELLTIDEAAFEYFNTLINVVPSADGMPFGNGTAPANPSTNWNNDALGYFSVYSTDSKSIVVDGN